MKKLSSILFLIFSLNCFSQTIELKLTDAENNEPIVNAHIWFSTLNDTLFTLSNFDGIALIKAKTNEGELKISHISFQEKIISIRPQQKKVSIAMVPKKDQLDEVVITGLAQESLASEAVRTIHVIDQKRIEKQAAVNLRDLLSNDLNFGVSEDGVLGSQLSLGGLGGQKIKILIDGVPVIGRLDGNIDLSQINLNNIERVEIIQGPMAVQYGTDAIAGTINLITKKKPHKKPKGQLYAFYESVGRYNLNAQIGFPIKGASADFSLGRNYFDGFDLANTRDLQWNPKEQYFSQLSLQKKYGRSLWGYSLNYFDENISNKGAVGSIDSLVIPVPDTSGAYKYPRALDDTYYTTRLDNAIRFQHYFKHDKALKIHVAYNYYKRVKKSEIINLNTLQSSLFGGEDAQDTTVFQTVNSRGFFDNRFKTSPLYYQIGYEVNLEQNKGERIEGNEKNLTDIALFISTDYKPTKKITIQPGFRYGYNSQFKSPLLFSLATKFNLNKNWALRASYGKGFRAPTLKELYFFFVDENHNILGNPDLKSEQSHNYQATLSYKAQRKNGLGEISLNAFFNDISNEIRLVSVIEPDGIDPRGLFKNVNVAQTQTTGGNLQSKIKYHHWQTELGVSLIGLKNNLSFSSTEGSKSDFIFYPQYRSNLSYEFPKWNIRASFFLNHTGSRKDLIDTGEEELSTIRFDAYTISDLTLQKAFLNRKINLSIGVKNLFDVNNIQSNIASSGGAHNAGSNSFPINYGRTYFFNLQYSF